MLPGYDSGEQNQSEWKKETLDSIRTNWPGRAPTALPAIQTGVEQCVDLQIQMGCEAIILPTPLTHDPNTTYEQELVWLEEGIAYARDTTDLPVFASVAI